MSGRTKTVEELAAEVDAGIDEMVGHAVTVLDEGVDPAEFAARLTTIFHRFEPDRACTLAAYALVRLAQAHREARP